MQRTLKTIVSVFGAFIVKITILVLQGQDSMKLILTLFIFFFFTACVLKLLFCVQIITSLFAKVGRFD